MGGRAVLAVGVGWWGFLWLGMRGGDGGGGGRGGKGGGYTSNPSTNSL